MNLKQIGWAIATLMLASGCASQKAVTAHPEPTVEPASVMAEEPSKDKPVWLPKGGPYQPESTRKFDLKHTRLQVRFDWQKQHMPATAELTMTPWFYPQDSVILDAKGFIVDEVKLVSGKSAKPLMYKYDGQQLRVALDKTYKKGEDIIIKIKYTARPEELPVGGSAAITEDKGLYFINPTGSDPDKPQQIWTQGETQANSKWFPTFDAPNRRCTQEIFMTVQDKYTNACRTACLFAPRKTPTAPAPITGNTISRTLLIYL